MLHPYADELGFHGVFIILQVNEYLGLSPGIFTQRHSERLERKRKAQKDKAGKVAAKKRRCELRTNRGKQESSRQVREGPTYAPGVALDSGADISEIPSHRQIPSDAKLIFFDLETTGLGQNPDIVQLAAVCDKRELNRYICPNKSISNEASRITGFSVINDTLYWQGQLVNTVMLQQALLDLLDFAKSLGNAVIMIGHNIRRYDIPILYRCLKANKMVSVMQEATCGCVDSLQVFKKVLPKNTVANFKQTTLVEHFLQHQYGAHNAIEDVRALQELYKKVLDGQYSLSDYIFQLNAPGCLQSLKPLVEGKALSAVLASRLAASGIGTASLKLAHDRDPEQGIALVLNEQVSFGKPRITSNKSVIGKIVNYFSAYPNRVS